MMIKSQLDNFRPGLKERPISRTNISIKHSILNGISKIIPSVDRDGSFNSSFPVLTTSLSKGANYPSRIKPYFLQMIF